MASKKAITWGGGVCLEHPVCNKSCSLHLIILQTVKKLKKNHGNLLEILHTLTYITVVINCPFVIFC